MRLTLEGVLIRFDERVILDFTSAEFEGGECVAVMGPSGIGKSTLLGVIARSVSRESGILTLDDRDLDPHDVDWLFQSTPLLQRRRVLDNVRLSALLRGVSEDEANERSLTALAVVGLSGIEDQLVFKLSGGEKQRVAIARAMTARASIILADEPTASLDPSSRAQICDALLGAARRGAIVVVATHDEFVASRCDRILTLSDGKLSGLVT